MRDLNLLSSYTDHKVISFVNTPQRNTLKIHKSYDWSLCYPIIRLWTKRLRFLEYRNLRELFGSY
jgi:hypothetical protein